MRKSLCTLAALAAVGCAPAYAAIDNYFAALLGANEVPSVGDPDGFGSALMAIDNVANTVSWIILAQNIAPITLAHIHQSGAGVNGPVKVDFNAKVTGSDLADPDLALINPGTALGFYVNIHTSEFPGGAIRGQLQYVGTVATPVPEPESYVMMLAGLGVVGLLTRRRARAAA